MKILFPILKLIFLIGFSSAEFTGLEWTDCGSPAVEFIDIGVKPMPILQPGQAQITFIANLLRGINGNLMADMNIVRTIAGLRSPLRWYLFEK
jgi:hypothetical protein